MHAFSARDLFYLYRSPLGDVAALRGLSLEIAEGETVAALGPSGSGKSTLLALAAGFFHPSSGELIVLDTHLERASKREAAQLRRRSIGIVRQHYHRSLPQELTVAEIVALPTRLLSDRRGDENAYVSALIARVGLADRAKVRPAELSGGEQQRVALCAALAKRPQLLLADEPTGEVDAYTRDEVVELMVELCAELGTAALIVTHDPRVAERTQRTIHIRDGRLAAEGTDRPVLVVDKQGWLRLPRGLRREARIGDRVRAQASIGLIELHAESLDEESDAAVLDLGDVLVSPDSQGSAAAVMLEKVVKRYGDPDPKPVIDLSWAAAPRRFHVIAGPSGSGKTTLLNLVAGLDRPDGGAITVAGQRIDTFSPDQSAAFRELQVGYLSQHSTLVDYMSARENVELALTFHGCPPDEAKTQADEWLEWVGLGNLADRPAEQLSGGEQRRVALARALAPTPRLLLADEPTAHLDQLTGRSIIQLLQKAVHEHGTTVIAASHDPDVIFAADELLDLDSAQGRIPTEHVQRRLERAWTLPAASADERKKASFSHRATALILAGLALVVTAITLGIIQPWNGSTPLPTAALLQNLRAAIATPTVNQVLYQHYALSAGGAFGFRRARIAVSSWTSGRKAPRHYRAIVTASGSAGRKTRSLTVQTGAILGPAEVGAVTTYLGRHRLGPISPEPPLLSQTIDPVGLVRTALANPYPPRAPIVSTDGRFVRVVLPVRDSEGNPGAIIYFANAYTYKPAKVVLEDVVAASTVGQSGGDIAGLASVAFLAPQFGRGDVNNDTLTFTYQTYAYKRATAAERKLTNIQAARRVIATPSAATNHHKVGQTHVGGAGQPSGAAGGCAIYVC